MKYLPYENITYRTRLSPQEVIRKLSLKLDSPEFNLSDFGKDSKPYIGKIEGDTFKMNPDTNIRNSTLIQITGELNENNEETLIDVKMRLTIAVKILATIWLVPFTAMLIAALINPAIQETSGFPIPRILGFIIPFCLFVIIGFKIQSTKAKKHLAKLFEAEIENTSNKRYKK